MASPLIAGYVTGLHRELPALIADEAADGLTEAYEHHLAAGTGEQEAARAALAEFGELRLVVGEYTRQAPGRRAARLLLATGPVAGLCWALALIPGRAWTWLAAATSRHSYHRTGLTAAASPVLLVLDAAAVAAVMLAAPALTPALAVAAAVSLSRIAFTAWTLPRLTAR